MEDWDREWGLELEVARKYRQPVQYEDLKVLMGLIEDWAEANGYLVRGKIRPYIGDEIEYEPLSPEDEEEMRQHLSDFLERKRKEKE